MLIDSSQTALLGNSSLFSLHQRMPWDDEGGGHAARPKLVALASHRSFTAFGLKIIESYSLEPKRTLWERES